MGVLQGIADVILILAAISSLIAFAFLGYAALSIVRLVRNVKGEVNVVSTTAQDAMSEARATGRFASESIVKPAALAVGYFTGVTATLKALSEDVRRKSRR